MTQRQAEYAKKLRRNIVVFAKSDLRMTIDQLHDQMHDLGYGTSLRKLSLSSLIQLNLILHGKTPQIYEILDAQGKKIWALYKLSDWSKERLYGFIAQHFGKSGIKYLTKKEKGALIKVLENYEQPRIHD
ncbi:MAG: hypothetical protein APR54_07665 [Candidatus Cloacimonas sp. SDB]|nr:MAG: hypothetical protein APR54_07665 [Candidatus Cloacimonas sp. SDB]